MKNNRPTCSPWLHARPGEQLGLSPRSSDRAGGLSTGAQRTRRSSKGARLSGRGSRKPSSAGSCRPQSGEARIYPCRDWRPSVLAPRGRCQWRLEPFCGGLPLIVGLLEFHATILRRPLWRSTRCGNQTAPLPIMPVHNSYSSRRATVAPMTEGKEFSVIQLPTFDWPKSHCVPSPRFRLFVAADVTSVSTDTLSDFSLGALNGGMVYFCAWGNGCERFHDIVDEILVEWTPERGIRRQTGGLESLRSASGATLVAAQLRWRTTPDASPQSAAPIRGAFSACSSRDQQPGVPHIRPWRRFRECYQIQQ